MDNEIEKINKSIFKSFLPLLIMGVLGLIILILGVVFWNYQTNRMSRHNLVLSWSDNKLKYGSASIFLDKSAGLDVEAIEDAHYKLSKSVTQMGDNPDIKMTDYAYSTELTLDIESERDKISGARVIAVGGDYFNFHYIFLTRGAFFSDEDLMKDGLIIDDNTALRLFGSMDIIGMEVYIGELPFIIKGVYENPKDSLATLTGEAKGFVYISYERAYELGYVSEIQNVDILAPNPLKNVAIMSIEGMLSEIISDSDKYILMDNSNRLSPLSILKTALSYFDRIIVDKAISLPYYENEMRLTELRLIFTGSFIICGIILFVLALIFSFRLSFKEGYIRIPAWREIYRKIRKE